MYTYEPKGVCSRKIDFDLVDDKIRNVSFTGGCPGNLKALSLLLEGMSPKEAISKLKGVTCGNKPTSCSDQFAKALEEALGK